MGFMSSETETQFNDRKYREYMEKFSYKNYSASNDPYYQKYLKEEEEYEEYLRSIIDGTDKKEDKPQYRIPFVYPKQ